MKVALDLRALEPGFKSHFHRGTGRYVRELVEELPHAAKGTSLEFLRLGASELFEPGLVSSCIELSPLAKGTLNTHCSLPRALAKQDFDLIHFFAHGDAPVVGLERPTVLSILDLIPLRFPELYRRNSFSPRYKLARSLELRAISKALGMIAISESTKRDLIEMLGIEESRIAVTPLAVSREFIERVENNDDQSGSTEFRREHGIPENATVLAYLGGIDPRKNVLFLVDLLKELVYSMEKPPFLILGGDLSSQREYPELKTRVLDYGLESQVIEAGFVDDINLVSFYRAADLFLFPSLYEGFGFPVLEAMAAGTVVVAGNNSSMPELSDGTLHGEKGVYLLEDKNIGVWVETVQSLLKAPSKLKEVSVAGIKRAHEFSWKRAARLTVEAWEEFSKSIPTPKSFISSR